MDNHKNTIFSAIGKIREVDADKINQQASQLLSDPSIFRPILPESDVLKSFIKRIESENIAATIEQIETLTQLPNAVKNYCLQNKLCTEQKIDLAIQPVPVLKTLDWSQFNITHHASANQSIALTLGNWGIAETGSIVINSGDDSPVLLNFLATHHILIVNEINILAYLDDYADQLQIKPNPCRTTCLITGASGTTDIEGMLVNGAHGPEKLHIVIITTKI